MKKKKTIFRRGSKIRRKEWWNEEKDEEFKRQGTILFLFLKMENKVAIMVDHVGDKRDTDEVKWPSEKGRSVEK